MRLFYHKLWQEQKPPIEALREAQLTIYRHPDLARLRIRIGRGIFLLRILRIPNATSTRYRLPDPPPCLPFPPTQRRHRSKHEFLRSKGKARCGIAVMGGVEETLPPSHQNGHKQKATPLGIRRRRGPGCRRRLRFDGVGAAATAAAAAGGRETEMKVKRSITTITDIGLFIASTWLSLAKLILQA